MANNPVDVDWHAPTIDWTLSNGTLGRALGVSDKTVERKRRELGKPPSTRRRHSIAARLAVPIAACLAIAVLFTGCTMSDLQMAQLKGRRDCLIVAVGFQDSYNADKRFDPHRWSKVLGIFWDDQRRIGHAVCVYQFGDNKIMVQGAGEKRGGWTLTRDLTLKDNPLALARLYAPGTPIREAYYFDDL